MQEVYLKAMLNIYNMPVIPLFYPNVTVGMKKAAYSALSQKIIVEGSTVKIFEKQLNLAIDTQNLLVVNSGTSALELAYYLLDLKPGL